MGLFHSIQQDFLKFKILPMPMKYGILLVRNTYIKNGRGGGVTYMLNSIELLYTLLLVNSITDKGILKDVISNKAVGLHTQLLPVERFFVVLHKLVPQ